VYVLRKQEVSVGGEGQYCFTYMCGEPQYRIVGEVGLGEGVFYC